MIGAFSSNCLWAVALKHDINVRKRDPYSTTLSTPFNGVITSTLLVITGNRTCLKNEHVFGCSAYMLRLPKDRISTLFNLRKVTCNVQNCVYKVLGSSKENPCVLWTLSFSVSPRIRLLEHLVLLTILLTKVNRTVPML